MIHELDIFWTCSITVCVVSEDELRIIFLIHGKWNKGSVRTYIHDLIKSPRSTRVHEMIENEGILDIITRIIKMKRCKEQKKGGYPFASDIVQPTRFKMVNE